MKRWLLSISIAGAALLVFSGLASAAAGVNFSWLNCYPDGNITDQSFACNTNSGTNFACGSYVTPPAGVPQVTGIEIVIDLATAGALPPWWDVFNAGSCRVQGLSLNDIPPASLVACTDYWQGAGTAAIAAYQEGLHGGNSARIKAVVAIPSGTQTDQTGDTEYFGFNLGVSHQKTVATGACAGCTTAACLTLNSILVGTTLTATNVFLSGGAAVPGNGGMGSDSITWQTGAGVSSTLGTGCPAATPTHNRTWGQIKSLYR